MSWDDSDTRYTDSKTGSTEQEGAEFQDFVCVKLAKVGFVISVFTSKQYQLNHGESLQGVEIKLDSLCTRTRRLSIEVEEKTRLDRDWHESGIYRRDDNTWIYLQGNKSLFYLFDVKVLRELHERGDLEMHETGTIRAFYLPLELADKKCLRQFDFRMGATDSAPGNPARHDGPPHPAEDPNLQW